MIISKTEYVLYLICMIIVFKSLYNFIDLKCILNYFIKAHHLLKCYFMSKIGYFHYVKN